MGWIGWAAAGGAKQSHDEIQNERDDTGRHAGLRLSTYDVDAGAQGRTCVAQAYDRN